MKVAVTGASGYVGSKILQFLKKQGFETISLSRRESEEPWIPYTLEGDPAKLPLDEIDVLIHAAYDFSHRKWPDILEANVDPSIQLFKAAKVAGIKKIIFISSMSSFEGCKSLYGQAKFMLEGHALEHGAIVVRPGLVWGEISGGVMGSLEKIIYSLPLIPTLSHHSKLPQYLVHEEDLASNIADLIKNPPSERVVSIAHPDILKLVEVLKRISSRRNLKRWFFPIPTGLVMMALKVLEFFRIKLSFRSDSLVGLIYSNPSKSIVFFNDGDSCRRFE